MANSSEQYDVVVIGSGPGGYVAAVRAAHNGLKVAIVEKDKELGGTCLLRGCIPTKSMLHSADVYEELQHAESAGVFADNIRFDFAKVQKARADVVKKSAAGVKYLMRTNKIDVHPGLGSLVDSHTVQVVNKSETTQLKTKTVILATGSVPASLPFITIDKKHFITSDEALELKSPPKSMLILGSGAVGVEFASVYARFGTEVTIVEMLDRLLPNEDRDVSKEFMKIYKKAGIDVRIDTKLTSAEVQKGQVVAQLEHKGKTDTLKAEVCLVAVGRKPVTDSLNLKAVGIETDQRGCIPVNGFGQTSVSNIYAIGDITITPWLAHIASHEGTLAADHIAGKEVHAINYHANPSCTYSKPEVASVGFTEERAKESGYDVKVGKFPFSALGKARIMGDTTGFVKIIADKKYDEILGVHIIGPRATDLIAEACVAIQQEVTAEELAHTIHAHPTLPEAMLEAAHGVVHKPIHL